MKPAAFIGILVFFIAGFAAVSAQTVKEQPKITKPSANEARNVAGFIEEDAQIEGITIINGEVSIDGVKIPHGQKKYRSAKSGKTYRIEWGSDNNVSVEEQ